MVEATGEVLFNALKECLTNIGLGLVDCIGFGCDGASSMFEKHNSVWSRIKQVSSNCLLVPCICHSLALSIAHAFDKLPSHLGHLLSEIPRWFSNSALRQNTFKTLFDIMDPNGERAGTPTPFQKQSATRWLVRGKVIFAILTNWEELKAYFLCTKMLRPSTLISVTEPEQSRTCCMIRPTSCTSPLWGLWYQNLSR